MAVALLVLGAALGACGTVKAALLVLSTSACQPGDLPGYSSTSPSIVAKHNPSLGTYTVANSTLRGDAAQFPISCSVVDMRSAEAASKEIQLLTQDIKEANLAPSPGTTETPPPLFPVGQFDVSGVPNAVGLEGTAGRSILFRFNRFAVYIDSGYSSEPNGHRHVTASRRELTVEARDTYGRLCPWP